MSTDRPANFDNLEVQIPQPRRGMQTALIHDGDPANPSDAIASPIYQSATYQFDDPEAISKAMEAVADPEFYGRYGSPNTKQVELTVANLEGGEAGLAVASGMSAVSLALLSHLHSGDHLVAQKALYPTTYTLMSKGLAKLGIDVTFVEHGDSENFKRALRPQTRMIYMESPTNPTLSLTDIRAVTALSKDRHIVTVADNTFATPFNQKPLEEGVDLVLNSATKYLSGHADVVAGVLVGSRERIEDMWRYHIWLGGVLHPFEAWLLLRGLKTFGIRMAQHNRSAMAIAEYLASHQAVSTVHYPGLPDHPQQELATRQMKGGFGGMIAFEMKDGFRAATRVLEKVRVISLAVSFGGPHSLITHPASTVSRVQSEAEISASGVRPGLLRLSIGLEDIDDLLADLEQALS